MSRKLRLLAAGLIGLGLAACGGGGGDLPPVAQTPAAQTPLLLTSANAAAAAGLAPAVGESVLSAAQYAVDLARGFSAPGATSPATATCPNGGLSTVTLIDRDGNGVASAGDHLTAVLRDCAVPVLTDIANGTIEIDLVDTAGLPPGSLRGTADFGTGLAFAGSGAQGGITVQLAGTLAFEWARGAVSTRLQAASTGRDDLRVLGIGSTKTVTEAIRQFVLTKTLKYDEARSVASFALRFDSEALGGSLLVSTPEPLMAYLNTYPEQGRIVVTGASGGSVTLRPNFVTDSDRYRFDADLTGDGVSDTSGSAAWTEAATGYLWWDGTTPLSWGTSVFATRGFSTLDFRPSFSFTWTTSTATEFRTQFSRPLAASTPTLFMRFYDIGSATGFDPELVNVDAVVLRQGALLVATPAKALRHGRNYLLQSSTDGQNWSAGVVALQDTLGTSLMLYPSSVTTPDTLRAVVSSAGGVLQSAADRIQLLGSGSTSTGKAIVAYRWTQASGTAVLITSPNSANTEVAWSGAAPVGVEQAVLRLTVTDAGGDSESSTVVVWSVNPGTTNHVLYFRSTAGDYVGAGRTLVIGDSSGVFTDSMIDPGYLRTLFQGTQSEFWFLDLATTGGVPFQVGAYEGAVRASFRGQHNGIDFSGDGRGCNETSGRFDVLEVAMDANGKVIRLAVDFEQHCESAAAPPLFGSYRLNSAMPIRR